MWSRCEEGKAKGFLCRRSVFTRSASAAGPSYGCRSTASAWAGVGGGGIRDRGPRAFGGAGWQVSGVGGCGLWTGAGGRVAAGGGPVPGGPRPRPVGGRRERGGGPHVGRWWGGGEAGGRDGPGGGCHLPRRWGRGRSVPAVVPLGRERGTGDRYRLGLRLWLGRARSGPVARSVADDTLVAHRLWHPMTTDDHVRPMPPDVRLGLGHPGPGRRRGAGGHQDVVLGHEPGRTPVGR